MPLTALFILFDFVVHNPTHPDTKSNLPLLGIVAGYFCRVELASAGALQSSLLSEFAHIARDYVQDIESGIAVGTAAAVNGDGHTRQSIVVNAGPETPSLSLSVSHRACFRTSPERHKGNSDRSECEGIYYDRPSA